MSRFIDCRPARLSEEPLDRAPAGEARWRTEGIHDETAPLGSWDWKSLDQLSDRDRCFSDDDRPSSKAPDSLGTGRDQPDSQVAEAMHVLRLSRVLMRANPRRLAGEVVEGALYGGPREHGIWLASAT